jgi:hypothetical protein
VILRQGRFVAVAAVVVFAAFFFGLGTFLTGAQPPAKPQPGGHASAAQRSGDDDGFSMTLAEPREHYLVGIRRIVIEPTLPPGDNVAGVDFFVDGRLVATDRRAPFATEIDFGSEIKRHTIIVTAQTAGGRHAKVSFISRAADLSGDPAVPIALVPAIVRDAAGRFVDGLSVGDFVLLENGRPTPILHFDNEPIPQSIVVGVDADATEEARDALRRGALGLADSLLSFDSLALLEVGSLTAAGSDARPRPKPSIQIAGIGRPAGSVPGLSGPQGPAEAALEFSYDRLRLESWLAGMGSTSDRRGGSLASVFATATRGLLARPRGRILFLLLAGDTPLIGPPAPEEAAPPARETAAPAAPAPSVHAPAASAQAAPPATLPEAIESFRKTGATLFVVVAGRAEGVAFKSLQRVAEESGGEYLVVESAPDVESACRRMSESLQHQYLITYAPANAEREGWRSIELRSRVPEHVVQARRACFAAPPVKKP